VGKKKKTIKDGDEMTSEKDIRLENFRVKPLTFLLLVMEKTFLYSYCLLLILIGELIIQTH